jgi:hypothetical protein
MIHWQKMEWSDLGIRSFMFAAFSLNLSFGLELGVQKLDFRLIFLQG